MTKSGAVAVTPLVREEATRLGVDLSRVTATGVGGRVRVADVRAAAPFPVSAAAMAAVAAWGAAYRLNPLVDELRKTDPAAAGLAAAKAPAPTLFSSGDLPPFTASGLDPAALVQLPWLARHAVASAPSLAEAYEIAEDVSGPDGDQLADMYADHPGVRSYQERVSAWASDRG